jgi:drug/metabolite transporter (DMT)-like permease
MLFGNASERPPYISNKKEKAENLWGFSAFSAGRTGLEPAASGVTGRRYNQLNYRPVSGGAVHTTAIRHHNEKVRAVSDSCALGDRPRILAEFRGVKWGSGDCAGCAGQCVWWRTASRGRTTKKIVSQSIPVRSSPVPAPPERPLPERPSVRAWRERRREALWGALCVVGSAVAFSSKAVLAKVGYRLGAEPSTLLALRMGFALPFFVVAAVVTSRGRAPLPRAELGKIVGLGVLGYYLASVLDFYGLVYISAGLERLILFVYPTLVVLMSAWLFKTPITRRTLVALGLTYGGVLLAVKTETAGASGARLWAGVALIFGCALSYAAYLVGSGRLIPRVGSLRFTALALIVSTAAMLVHFVIVGGHFAGHPAAVYVVGALLALVCTVLPVFLLAEGIRRIGAGPSAIIGAVGPVSTIALAHWVLGEPVHFLQAVGTLLVLVGATVTARSR